VAKPRGLSAGDNLATFEGSLVVINGNLAFAWGSLAATKIVAADSHVIADAAYEKAEVVHAFESADKQGPCATLKLDKNSVHGPLPPVSQSQMLQPQYFIPCRANTL